MQDLEYDNHVVRRAAARPADESSVRAFIAR